MDSQRHYVDLIRLIDTINLDISTITETFIRVMKSYLDTAKSFEEARQKYKKTNHENIRLSKQLAESQRQTTELERLVQSGRKLLDEEKLKTKAALRERDHFEHQLDLFREILRDSKELHEETKTKLNFLKPIKDSVGDHLDTITELETLETTGSILSDLSYTRDEDDILHTSENEIRGAKRHFCDENEKPPVKKRKSVKKIRGKSMEKVIATTTVTVEHNGPISATSVVETFPATPLSGDMHSTRSGMLKSPKKTPMTIKTSESEGSLEPEMLKTPSNDQLLTAPFSMNTINTRPHRFIQKSMIKAEVCNVCNKRIKFSTTGVKCRDCKSMCHAMCKDKVPLPCVPLANTPNKNGAPGTIADYTPVRAPMVPALIVHCIKEIEARGMTEVGLYRVPGSDKEVKALKEKFFKGKGIPNLSQIPDVHTICGCLKEFLRSLKEPIITQIRWEEFARTAEIADLEERRSRLFHIVSELPQPNRDTLAYIVLHLQRVAESPDCKMPTSNLAKMFGPTIVGYSRNEPENMFTETNLGNKVMGELLSLPAEYWATFMRETDVQNENDMVKSPSSNSLLNFLHTPGRQHVRTLRKMRYFESP